MKGRVMDFDERFEKAKEEIEAVCKKYKIYLMGCGCCGSPWVGDTEAGSRAAGEHRDCVEFNVPFGKEKGES